MFLKFTLLPLIVIFGILEFIILLIVWNEPFRTWEMKALRRQGRMYRPVEDHSHVYRKVATLEYENRHLDKENRNLRRQLDEERKRNRMR